MRNYIQDHYDKIYSQNRTREIWKSIDRNGNPLPWITYSALFQLEQFDFTNCEIFEWGSGYSTLYWSNRCKVITTVEHEAEWYQFVAEADLDNASLNLVTLERYVDAIGVSEKKYDLVIIDGYIMEKMRFHCVKGAVDHLKEGGMILLDNSDWLSNTCEWLREQGFIQTDYVGFGPINNYPWCTSIFFKNQMSIPRKKTASPGFVPGGIHNIRD